MPAAPSSPAAPLRVLIDATAPPAELTGVGTYLVDLCAAVARRDDVSVTVVTRPELAGRFDADHEFCAADGPRPLRLAWEQSGLPLLALRCGAQVIHSPHYTMPVASPVPCTVVFHDTTMLDSPELHEAAKVRFFRAAMRVSAMRAARLIAVSQTTADDVCRHFGLPGDAVDVVPHGIDLTHFGPPSAAQVARMRSRLGIDGPYVCFLGTLEPRKNLPRLIEAFTRARQAGVVQRLVLAGRAGWHTDAFEAAVARAGLGDALVRLGYVDEADKPALLGGADVVTYPSLAEGFGLPVLEAMACGTAVLTANVSATAEVAGDAACGVDPTDVDAMTSALVRLCTDPAERERLSVAGRARAAAYSWDAAAAGTVASWRRAAQRRGIRGRVRGGGR